MYKFYLTTLVILFGFVLPASANTNNISDESNLSKDSISPYYQSGYHGIIEAGYAISIDVPELNYFKFNFVNGHMFSNFAAGLGLGLRATDYRESILVPVFADFRIYFTKTSTAPYLNMAVGHSFNTQSRATGGVYLNGAIGANFLLLSNKSAIHMGLGYEMQDINSRMFKVLSFNVGTSF